MKFLDSIEVPGEQRKRIELYQGDLTILEADENFDLLVISAFPNDYTPTENSLIGALYRKGLSVAALAMNKDVDLRESFSCWLSNEFTSEDTGLRFKRILCFEPLIRGKPPELVGDIFRALTPILAERPDIKTLALPIVAAGDQGYPVTEMLTPLLEAAYHWLKAGLPLDCIKIVVQSRTQSEEAVGIFSVKKNKYSPPPITSSQSKEKDDSGIRFSRSMRKDGPLTKYDEADYRKKILSFIKAGLLDDSDYDVFISYSRANTNESEALERALRESQPDIRIFVDRKEINIGAAWQSEIFENLDKCRKMVALLSPDYLSSKMCKEEYNIAWIRSRETDQDIIFPIYLYSAGLPTYMKYRNYFDCREGDKSKIAEASKELLAALES